MISLFFLKMNEVLILVDISIVHISSNFQFSPLEQKKINRKKPQEIFMHTFPHQLWLQPQFSN